ncbi:hypothetical protein ACIQOW_37000 [Kitasatospora sp. NPDC091335]|uniref:hypothetical protein n=1 Tax=Kitasatospora sp. NPDC091335 TaxID=3364085 RepID=UPI00382FE653
MWTGPTPHKSTEPWSPSRTWSFTASAFADGQAVPLERDGLTVSERGRITWIRPPLRSQTQDLIGLRDPSGILAELQRISRDLATDPAGAIGSAKQLIEATAKTVLLERGLTVDENAKIPALVKQAQKALALDAFAITPGLRECHESGGHPDQGRH